MVRLSPNLAIYFNYCSSNRVVFWITVSHDLSSYAYGSHVILVISALFSVRTHLLLRAAAHTARAVAFALMSHCTRAHCC